MNPELIPLLGLYTEYGYQIKVLESYGSVYDRGTTPPTKTTKDSYFILRIEDAGEDKSKELPILIAEIPISQDELIGLHKALGLIVKAKGY